MKKIRKNIIVFTAIMLMMFSFSTSSSAFSFIAPHTHNYLVLFQKTASCTSKGYFLGICKKCLRITFEKSDKTHDWVISVETEPTCTTGGSENKTCSKCRTSTTVSSSALGHSYSDGTDSEGREVLMCSRCGDVQLKNPDNPVQTVERGDKADRSTITTGVSSAPQTAIGDYVTPDSFGAYGDGVHDDASAIQKAVDSGKNVVFTEGKTYYIAPGSYVKIADKQNFVMSGGTIHKGADGSNYNCFVITGCTDCEFRNMYIYSEFTATDIMTPANHTRPTGYSSNVLAFSGWNNNGIKFINNRFDYMDADYWFNANASKGEWKNVVVDGWQSSTSIMPLYCQYINGLEIKNARVSMSPTHSGDGDHILYICRMSRNVKVHDCYFSSASGASREVLLTFHGGSLEDNTCPKDILISDCTIEAGPDRALYSGNGASVNIKSCTIRNNAELQSMYLVTGDKSNQFHFENCILETTGSAYCIGQTKVVTVKDCTLRVDAAGAFEGPFNVTVSDSDIEIAGGSLCFSNNADGFNYSFTDCNITKSGSGTFLTSVRKTGGKLVFTGCEINCENTTYFMYNSGVNMSGVSFENTVITGKKLANSNENSGYTAVNSSLNGESL